MGLSETYFLRRPILWLIIGTACSSRLKSLCAKPCGARPLARVKWTCHALIGDTV